MERRGGTASTVGLIVLLLADLALVGATLRIPGPTTAGPTVSSTATPALIATTAERPVLPGTGTSATTVAAKPSPVTISLAAVDANIAWRASMGSCGSGGSALEVTNDGGRTWRNRVAPFPVLTRIQPTDASKAFVAGANEGCEMAVRTTTDSGFTWSAPGSVVETWSRDAKDPARVRTPGGRTAAPCGTSVVIDLARTSSTTAQALCVDGTIHDTTDAGRTWPGTARAVGGLALDNRQNGPATTAYVVVVRSGCDGLRVIEVVPGGGRDLGCASLQGTPPPGTVAVSVVGDVGWLVAGGDTWKSMDGLRTWSRA